MRPPPVDNPSRIFLLPNLMTAGNLIFGFLAVLKIFEGSLQRQSGEGDWAHTYVISLQCILGACLCDLLDGRLARLGGSESPFGREFDSLADIVQLRRRPRPARLQDLSWRISPTASAGSLPSSIYCAAPCAWPGLTSRLHL